MGRQHHRNAVRTPHMSENAFQQKILDLCGWLGLHVYHTYDSRRSQAGFPDLVIVGPHGVIFAELKSTKGRVSVTQQEWLDRLAAADARVHLWRPEDWPVVENELTALSGRHR